ncbi:DHA2 family multidrug resistance protein [Chryseobacterium ginsenosidimutans]|uniref:DHA2 family efflux MFS transporter permease subunit n=1 Tax=Chryseobacterium ginsenosidimutans TaxID=687846 RepID=UPI002166CA94|nr:DHA2 family efflux MFS transporter permease subunit [Chryseobacterium ginsenosidimutans]MCS3869936.1 DHA2 family multidrug resistance protein [Chryseobacterium ginsenosidimutans]
MFRKNLLIITVLLAAVMELIDATIVNVALSHMSGNLGATIEDTSWVITSYSIANVIIIPITSFLTAKLGRRNYYIGSIVIFTICSVMCGLSNDIWTLVFFRFIQGLGGGALLSVSQAVIFEQFPKEKHSVAGAIFGIGVFIGPTIGPTLGGYIVDHFSWPWIFFVNIPVGIIAIVSCFFLLTEPPVKAIVKKIDWTGIALLAIGVGTLQTVLERGETEDWFATGYIVWFSIIAIISLASFIYWELKISNPVVDLTVLKSKTLSIAAILTFITGVGLYGSIFITPIIAQRLLGFTPLQTGEIMLPGALLAVLALIISGRLMQKGLSPVYIVAMGYILFIYFNWHMAHMSLDASAEYIAFSLIFRSVGMAFLAVPLTTMAVSSLQAKDIPQGAALNNMMRQLGGSFGISIINTYYVRRTWVHRNDLVSHLTYTDTSVMERINKSVNYFMAKGFNYYDAHTKAIALLEAQVVKQTSVLSYLDAFYALGACFILTMPLLFFVRMKKKAPNEQKVIISDH